MQDERPIAAVSTAPGQGAIGVVRVSAPDAAALDAIVEALIGRPLEPRRATYGPFRGEDGTPIDVGLAIRFPAPRSYTGEHVLELQGHGGPVVLQLLLRRVLAAGAAHEIRLAEPGEFTERAFLNDKLDLAQAEAVADLIEASTEQAARSATRSLSGVFSERITVLADRLLELRMLVEATLDFPEEEIEFLERANAVGRLDAIAATLAEIRATAKQGVLLRQGLSVVLVGAPNVGKSSLLNALAGAEVAIVTPIAGTTRDRVVQTIAIDGVPLHLIDTAGLRETDDLVERIGIQRTWDEIGRADVVVHLVAARTGRPVGAAESGRSAGPAAMADNHADDEGGTEADDEAGLLARIAAAAPARAARLTVVNKIDLAGSAASADDDTVWLSALTGDGIDLLRAALLRIAGFQPGAENVFAARERHLEALREAGAHIDGASALAARGDAALDLMAEELRLAHAALGRITGAVSADELLGVIFSRFCIGK